MRLGRPAATRARPPEREAWRWDKAKLGAMFHGVDKSPLCKRPLSLDSGVLGALDGSPVKSCGVSFRGVSYQAHECSRAPPIRNQEDAPSAPDRMAAPN